MTSTTPDATTATTDDWISALRACQDRLATLAGALDAQALGRQSYDTEWTIAQVVGHLGSQAEIYALYLQAGLDGTEPPGTDANRPIWAAWDAKTPTSMRDDSVAANEALVSRIEALPKATAETFRLGLFGLDLDLAGFARLRLAELAIHTWDAAVALDRTAVIHAEPVGLLVDGLGMVATWTGKPSAQPYSVRIVTLDPGRTFVVTVGDAVALSAGDEGGDTDGQLELSAEAFLRLVYGRLDPEHTPAVTESGSRGLADLRAAFPGV